MSGQRKPQGLSRREFLRSGAGVVGLTATAAFLQACGQQAPATPQVVEVTRVVEKEKEKVIEKPVEVTKVVEKEVAKEVVVEVTPTPAPVQRDTSSPLRLLGWPYHEEVVKENIEIFMSQYDEKVEYQMIPGDYHPVIETKFIGQEKIDVVYSEEDHLQRWYKAGWTIPIEDMPEAQQIKDELYPAGVETMSNVEGELMGLPYYSAFIAFWYNQALLEKGGIDTTQLDTWEQIIEHCRKLKQDGVSKYPYQPSWARVWYGLDWSIWGDWFAEGANVFDKEFNPVFQDEPAFQKVLERYKLLFDEKLVPEDALAPGEGALGWASGEFAFGTSHSYVMKENNDPATSKAAGFTKNILMPGEKHETFRWVAQYFLCANHTDLERAWNLHKFVGWKDKEGNYLVSKKWALNFGLGTPWKAVMEDPEVVANWGKWCDMEMMNKQGELTRARPVDKALWYPEWGFFMMEQVQNYIQGAQGLPETVKALQDKAVELKSKYG